MFNCKVCGMAICHDGLCAYCTNLQRYNELAVIDNDQLVEVAFNAAQVRMLGGDIRKVQNTFTRIYGEEPRRR